MRYSVIMGWAVILVAAGCSREQPVEPVERVSDTGSLDAIPFPAEVPAERLLSLRDPGAAADEPAVPREPDESPVSGEPKPEQGRNRVIYTFIDPETMLSGGTKEDERAVVAPEPLQGLGSKESRFEDMAAMAYVEKSRMISDEFILQVPASEAARDLLDTGPGFLSDFDPVMDDADVRKDIDVTAAARDPEAVEQVVYFVREAEKQLAVGNEAVAGDLLAKAWVLFPDSVYVNRRLGQLALRRGDYQQAVRYLSGAVEAGEGVAETLNELGIAYLYSGRYTEALGKFNDAAEADRDFIESQYNAGLALRRLGRIGEARERLYAFLAQEPDNARAYRELAMISLAEDSASEALDFLQRAMLLDDAWAVPHLDAAVVYNSQSNFVAAVDALYAALRRGPAVQIFRLYSSPAFREVRLIPESRDLEAALSRKLRGVF